MTWEEKVKEIDEKYESISTQRLFEKLEDGTISLD